MLVAPRYFAAVNAAVVGEFEIAAASIMVLQRGQAAEGSKWSGSWSTIAHWPTSLVEFSGGFLRL